MSQGKRVVDTSSQQVHDFFVSKGWSSAQAYGIAGNVKQESGFASNAYNRNAKEESYGLFQFNSVGNPAAYSQFQRIFGKPLTQANALEQMEFVNWQLNNTEKKAGDALRKTTNPYDAGMVFGEKFERPAIVEKSRGLNALEFAKGKVSGIADKINDAFSRGKNNVIDNTALGRVLGNMGWMEKNDLSYTDEDESIQESPSLFSEYWIKGVLIVGSLALIIAGGYLKGRK